MGNRLVYAKVLLELREMHEAEREAAFVLVETPGDAEALRLLARIKHMRGELTRAIACWGELHARSMASEPALLQLGSMLHMAQSPAHAGEFLAAGPFQLQRKPRAYVELEEAFRLVVARRPKEARAHCDAVAGRHRKTDRGIYKLAVLGAAWIEELCGDLEAAAARLERLGLERGFEVDTDRILALASLYERIGSREKLEAAVNICRFLERMYGGTPVLGRLALVCRRLGLEDHAREYARRHLDAFRRAHRPTLAEVLHAAARWYLPIDRLRGIPLAGDEPGPAAGATARERAVAAALRGDAHEARGAFEAGGSALDRKYLADLAALEGCADEAAALYLAALDEDPDDLRVIGRVLDGYAERGAARVASAFRDGRRAARAAGLLEDALRAEPLNAALWRRLAVLCTLAEPVSGRAEACAARAEALERAAARRESPIGRVLAAAVYHFVGKAVGLIHEVWAGREPVEPGRGGALSDADILGNLTDEMKADVRNIFLAAREYACAKFPHLTADIRDWRYTYKVTKDDEPSGGTSAGLPTALAFLSVFLQRAIPQDLAATGAVIADAHDVLVVRRVGEVEHKVDAAYQRGLRAILVPSGNRADLAAGTLVPLAICDEIARHVGDLDEAARAVFGEDIFV